MRGRVKKLLRGTLPRFLALWAVMMGLLVGLNLENQNQRAARAMESALQEAAEDFREIRDGGADEDKKPLILTGRLGQELYSLDGVAQFRFYTPDGQVWAETPMAMGSACPPGSGAYSWYLLLDPALSQEEQLALAELLRDDWELGQFFGSEGGLVSETETDERYCEVTGVADHTREVIVPKAITYVYQDRTVTLVDSDSGFFQGKELETLRFDAVQIYSRLSAQRASPGEMLDCWQEAEDKLDRFVDASTLSLRSAGVSSDGSQYAPIDNQVILASSYACTPWHILAEELGITALLTLLAAVLLARYTDRKQRAAIQRERDFTRAAAHELKTPLAILQAHGEALREDILPEKRAEYLDVILDECGRMSALVGRLLELSRLESGTPLQKEPLDLAALVREVWEPLALPLEQRDITLKLDLEALQLEGDRERLREAAGNLASNALRHCTPGGTIRVALKREGSRAVLTVYNDGEPIPETDLPHLFQPFYRGGDKSRSRDSGGTGLGLAIVRAAALAHGGECGVENTGGGAVFRLSLPLEGQPAP